MPRHQSVSYTDSHECVDIGQLCIQPDAAFIRPSGGNVPIEIEWQPLNFGGERPYFVCPVCNRRCRKLYNLACYKCRGLKHRTKSLSPRDRAIRKAILHRRNHGQDEGGIGEPFPDKPPHMKWETYWKAYAKAQRLDAEALAMFEWPKQVSKAFSTETE